MSNILPKAIALSNQSSITLKDLLSYEFGSAVSSVSSVNLFGRAASYYVANNFDYWDPLSPISNQWTVNGVSIQTGVTSQQYWTSDFQNISFTEEILLRLSIQFLLKEFGKL